MRRRRLLGYVRCSITHFGGRVLCRGLCLIRRTAAGLLAGVAALSILRHFILCGVVGFGALNLCGFPTFRRQLTHVLTVVRLAVVRFTVVRFTIVRLAVRVFTFVFTFMFAFVFLGRCGCGLCRRRLFVVVMRRDFFDFATHMSVRVLDRGVLISSTGA